MSTDALRVGSESHYEDAAYYDQTYRRRRDDVRFYTRRARAHGGPVLELGVGTGRVALAVAREGVEVFGVDRMSPMLERLRSRLEREPQRVREAVTLVNADLYELALERRFGLVMAPFHVLNHVYTYDDLERALGVVKAHLEVAGQFMFDVRLPDPVELARDPRKVYRVGKVPLPGRSGLYHVRERYDYDAVTQVQTVEMAFIHVDDPSSFELQMITHRCYFPAELEALLRHSGFVVRERFGDFTEGPLDETSDSQVYVCELA